MNRIRHLALGFAALAAVACVAVAGVRPARAATAGELLACLQAGYRPLRDVAARFSQESRVATLGRPRTRTGTMVFAAPGKMRWEYAPPDPQLIVADGTTLWVYRPERRQAIERPLDAAFTRQTPLLFLLGEGDLAAEFSWRDGEVAAGPGGTAVVALAPRVPAPDLVRLELEIVPGVCRLAGTTVEDAFGNVTRLVFTEERRNTGAAAALFRFAPPPGTEVVRP